MTDEDREIHLQNAIAQGPTAYYSRKQNFERWLLYALVAAVIGLGGGYLLNKASASDAAVAAAKAQAAAASAAKNAQGSCQFWGDLSQIEFSSTPGFKIVADARGAYERLGCEELIAPLPAASAGVLPFLAPGVH